MSKLVLLLVVTLVFHVQQVFALNSGEDLPVEVRKAILENSVEIEGKIVLVDFWASWCTPCGLSLPWLETLSNKWPGKVQVVTINVDKSDKDASRMLNKLKLNNLMVVYDREGKLPGICDLKTMPSSFLFNQSHKLVSEYRGFRESDKAIIEKAIETLITSK
jgi:thiol-disulfide isomerase/thioredoxin